MALRGEVLASRRTFGFGKSDTLELFVVLQSEGFTQLFGTVVVAPIRRASPDLARWIGAVPVRMKDGGHERDLLVLPPLMASLRADRFEEEPRGRLDARTMAAVDRVLRALLALR